MKGMSGALGRMWIALVIVAAIAVGGEIIYRFHGVFGSQHSAGEGFTENIVSTVPKYLTYEVYGPSNTSGMISYLDEHAQSQEAQFTTLPWTHSLTTTLPSVFANVLAQGDSRVLGCRITVNGELRTEQAANGFSATTFCLVKAG